MGMVVCKRCGEEFEEYYISHLPGKMRSAFMEGTYCPRCRTRVEPSDFDKKLATKSIIEILQEVRDKFRILGKEFGIGRIQQSLPQNAYSLLEDYFYTCQMAESRIKEAGRKGVLTYQGVEKLNEAIGKDVSTLISFLPTNRILNEDMMVLAEKEPSVIQVIKDYSGPQNYEAFVLLNRKGRPLRGCALIDRVAESKSR